MKSGWILGWVASLFSVAAFAGAGGMDTGGGNLREIREHRIRIAVQNLKSDLLDLLSRREWLETLPGSEPLISLLDRGLLADIQNSRHELRSRCFDSNGVERAGAAVIGAAGGTICFNLPMLIDNGGTERDLLSLAIHEHAHQLGISDEAEAVLAGESVALYLAARLVAEPRPDRQPRIIPTDLQEREGCFNFHRFLSRLSDLPEGTLGYTYLSDFMASATDPADAQWLPDVAVRSHWGGGPKNQDPRTWAGSLSNFYQSGCEELVFRFEGAETRLPVIEYSPQHLVGEYRTPNIAFRYEFRAPEGVAGNRVIMRMTMENVAIIGLQCAEGIRLFNGSGTMEHVGVIGESLPERISVSTRLLNLLHQSSSAPLPEGCRQL